MKLNAKSAPRPPESNAIDGSSVIWIIGPLVLPNGIVGKDSAEKRFLYYTSQGLDIQDANGTSLGERNAIASQRTQNCTLPISAIVVHGIHVDETDERFLKHWEERISAEISSQIMTLLYVQWFRRIWVLQEVATERSVLFMYGAHEIAGGIFRQGLQALNPFYEHDATLQGLVGSIIRLTDWHLVHDLKKLTRLNILPLHELIHSRRATVPRDKMYALLGTHSDDFDTKTLDADYNKSWPEVFRDLVQMTFGSNVDLSMSNSMGITSVRPRTYPIGRIAYIKRNVDKSGWQKLKFELRRPKQCVIKVVFFGTQNGSLRVYPSLSIRGDLVYLVLVQGAYNPTLVRLHEDHCSIVSAAMKVPSDIQTHLIYNGRERKTWLDWSEFVQRITCFPAEILFVWHWESTHEQDNGISSAERQKD